MICEAIRMKCTENGQWSHAILNPGVPWIMDIIGLLLQGL